MAADPETSSHAVLPRGGECQCVACERFFTSLSGFDFHQWWHQGRLTCLDPAEIGMQATERARGVVAWGFPGQDGEPLDRSLRSAAIDLHARNLGVAGGSGGGSVV